MKTYIAIDNGATGTYCIMSQEGIKHGPLPTKKAINYQKKKQEITRIDHEKFNTFLGEISSGSEACLVVIERPFVNPHGFKATTSGLRAFESVLIGVERNGLGHVFVDSREWQKSLLPSGIKGRAELKKASVDVAARLFPQIKTKDADSILMAEWARRSNL